MADVLIRGLEMPKNGERTTITVYGDGVWCVHYNNEPHGKAIPLPEKHGRLIDADALIKEIDDRGVGDCDWWYEDRIDEMPAIVPAEGGEGDA